jgi:hypothetical protein
VLRAHLTFLAALQRILPGLEPGGRETKFFNPHSAPLLFVVNSLILGALSAAIQSMLLSNLNACADSGEISDFKLWLAICSMCMTVQFSHIERANNLK